MTNYPLLTAHIHRWVNRHPEEFNLSDECISTVQRITVIERPDGVRLLFRGHSASADRELIRQRLVMHLRQEHKEITSRWTDTDQLIIY